VADTKRELFIEGQPVARGQQAPHGDYAFITPDYFQTLGIKLTRGRVFTDHDNAGSVGVAIIDEAMARKYWPSEDPLGKRITFEGTRKNPLWREVVGIVGHVKSRTLDGESRPQYYIPFEQRPESSMFLTLRTANGPASLAAAVRSLISSLDKDLPVYRVTTMEELVASSMAPTTIFNVAVGDICADRCLLAAIGVAGLTAYTVGQRTREIGLRMAVGAQQADVLKLVLGQGMVLVVAGLALGLAVAFALTRVMSTMLYGVDATDRFTFIGVSLLLAVSALLACYLPARSAMRLDPMAALRYE
jgi:putative ABC transport system permease protein